MKKFFPLGLVVAVLMAVALVGMPLKTNAQGAGLVSAVLNRLEKNRRDLKSLRSGISMEKYNAQLRDKDNYYGNVVYVPAAGRNANVRVEWQRPQHEILTVANGQYNLYRPRLKQVLQGKAGAKNAKAGSAFDFMNMSGAQLKARFDVQNVYEDTLWGGVGATHMTLMPKASASFKYAEIWVDGSGMPVQTKIVEKNDDATTIRLTDLQKNAGVSMDEFKQQFGGDVKVIRG
jgi:outer membrane lipoprotein-sorting protein